MYPDNLKGKPILWLWYLSDIGIIGVGGIISVIAISQLGTFIFLVIVLSYAFLTIRFQDTSIFEFLKYACAFFITKQQLFYWAHTSFKRVIEHKDIQKRRRE
jgi:hypothetical protein